MLTFLALIFRVSLSESLRDSSLQPMAAGLVSCTEIKAKSELARYSKTRVDYKNLKCSKVQKFCLRELFESKVIAETQIHVNDP